jgi:hypothetical protein
MGILLGIVLMLLVMFVYDDVINYRKCKDLEDRNRILKDELRRMKEGHRE